PRELFQQLLSEPPIPLNQAVKGLQFPAPLEAAVMRGLARNPADRQPTVTAFAADVTTALTDQPQAGGRGLLGALKQIVTRKH
ncbi:MAG: hypothetical protein HYS40_02035, partial [Gemmatimonadetes bacterium]|nr:hypothetical protein [Gemmatimonadota bacterium]